MELPDEIDSLIGSLRREPDSPDGCIFWDGSLQGVDFSVCSPGPPTEEQMALVQSVLGDYENLLRRARGFLARSIQASPEKFDVSKAIAEEIVSLPDDDLPFDLPALTFYEGNEWMIRFADGRYLPAFDIYGVSVEFEGTEPVTANNLSDSTEV
jgi:hypothetical protein